MDGLTAAVAGNVVAVDGDGFVHVVVRDVVWTGHGLRPDKSTQVDHIPILVADLETGNVGLIGAGLGFGLEIDPMDMAKMGL